MAINNLYDYFKSKNQSLPSIAGRTALANQYGIQNYTGSSVQNAQILASLQKADSTGNVYTSPSLRTPNPNGMSVTTTPSIITPNGVTVGGNPDVTPLPSQYQNIFSNPAPSPITATNSSIPTNPVIAPAPAPAPVLPTNSVIAPDSPLNAYNTTTGVRNPNYVDPNAPPIAPIAPASPADEISSEIDKITAQKQSIEDDLNGIGDARNQELTNTGVYDKLKQLDKLNGDLRQAKNNQSLIPLQADLTLNQSGPTTKADFASYTSPQLARNAISALTASTQAGALNDQINTQLAITNQKFDEKKANDQFMYTAKDKYLGTLQTAYSDIMTSEQTSALEDKKEQNALDLKNLDFNNGMLKDASTAAIKNGANPADVQAAIDKGDLSEIYKLGLTKTTDADTTQSVDTVNNIQDMLNNTSGLASSVGSGWLGDTVAGELISGKGSLNSVFGDANKFRTDAKALTSAATLAYFAKVKAQGATFGSMSDSEWDILSKASDTKYLGIDRDTGKSSLPEDVFKQRLKEYQTAAKKAVIYDTFQKAGKDANPYLKGVSDTYIDSLYKQSVDPAPTDHNTQDFSMDKGTANNVPQRNNNPGDVKEGGLDTVQALATGTDSQGHLIFPTPQAGFQALALDLKAKLSGNSKYLPADPSIEQLGKVYAEDGNWGKSVAAILGVPVSTATTSVPFENLIYAISKQEGFFS